MFKIYEAKNMTNGMVYVGKTNGEIDARIRRHYNRNEKESSDFDRALREYGLENFVTRELASTEDADTACVLEKTFIAIAIANPNGTYNKRVSSPKGISTQKQRCVGIKDGEAKEFESYLAADRFYKMPYNTASRLSYNGTDRNGIRIYKLGVA